MPVSNESATITPGTAAGRDTLVTKTSFRYGDGMSSDWTTIERYRPDCENTLDDNCRTPPQDAVGILGKCPWNAMTVRSGILLHDAGH
jgi:hypothetical protein